VPDVDEIWRADAEKHADNGDVIEIESIGTRIQIWRTFIFPKQPWI